MEDLNCSICHIPFTDVIETPCCGWGYCRLCLRSSLTYSPTCPNCRREVREDACRPNVMVQRMADNLPDVCPYGCDAKLTRSIVKDHKLLCELRPLRPEEACSTHDTRRARFWCEEDQLQLCEWCVVAGSHRHHTWKPRYFGETLARLAGLQVGLEPEGIHLPNLFRAVSMAARHQACLTSAWRTPQSPAIPPLPLTVSVPSQCPAALPSAASPPLPRTATSTSLTIPPGLQSVAFAASLLTLQDRSDRQELHPDRVSNLLVALGAADDIDTATMGVLQRGIGGVRRILGPRAEAGTDVPDEEDFEALKDAYHAKFAAVEGVVVRTLPLANFVVGGEVQNELPVLVEVRVAENPHPDRKRATPFSLAIVLDVSGSMAGAPLRSAISAVKDVIQSLGPEDRLQLITYSNDAEVVFTGGQTKDAMIALVDRVRPGGGTNIDAGLQAGFNAIQGDEGCSRRLFLFSDGHANTGERSLPHFRNLVSGFYDRGVSTSAFGIGAGYNEQLMKHLSEEGCGNYFFIDRPESTAGIVEKAFKGLQRTVGNNTLLKIRSLGVKGGYNVVVKKVVNGDGEGEVAGEVGTIRLGDLREKGLKQVLLMLHVEGVTDQDAGEASCEKSRSSPWFRRLTQPTGAASKVVTSNGVPLFEWELTYHRLDEGFLPPSPQSGDLRVPVIKDINTAIPLNNVDSWQPDALIALRMAEVSRLDREVVTLMDRRRYQQALDIKRRVVNILQGLKDIDEMGFVRALLLRNRQRVADLTSLADREAGRAAAEATISADILRKAIDLDACEEEDDDMGFGLFD